MVVVSQTPNLSRNTTLLALNWARRRPGVCRDRTHVRKSGLWITLIAAVSTSQMAEAAPPLGYLEGHGTRAYPIAALTWGMLITAVLVVIIVTICLLLGVFRRRVGPRPTLPGTVGVERPVGGAAWIYIGVGVTTVVLLAFTVWTVVTLAAVSRPSPGKSPFTVEITGHQWWWEVNYLGHDEPSRNFTTANEIHIPTGQPIEVKLKTADVIHSFWVPALTGKTDLIPGQTNESWIEADRPGIYRGQCTEYCGQQHAHMAFAVIADPPDQFKAWWNHQLETASAADPKPIADGENAFIAKCGICHAVRGTRAGGIVGPDLSHLMQRRTIAANTIPNTPGYLSAWIADPQHIKPGNFMPRLDISAADLTRIRGYLATLQ
jgi:cytochrome c oxidase subunit II